MIQITKEQAKHLIDIIHAGKDIAIVFDLLKQYGVEDGLLNNLEQEFIFGRFQWDYYERLQAYINRVAKTDFEVKQPNYDLFFSFSSKNEAETDVMVKALREAGISVFYSKEDLALHAGTSFVSKINEALRNSKHFALYCTPEAIASQYVRHECELFYGKHIEGGKQNRIFILKGSNFSEDLLKTVYLENIQRTDLDAVCRFFGKMSPQEKERQAQKKQEQAREARRLQELIEQKEAQAQKAQQEAREEQESWQLSLRANDIEGYRYYLKYYPNGKYAREAHNKIKKLTNSTPTPNPSIYWFGGGGVFLVILLFVWQPWATSEKQEDNKPTEVVKNEEKPTEEEKDYTETVKGVKFKMIRIPNQKYYMAEAEVTQELWEAVMGSNPSSFAGKPQNPVEQVSWDDIVTDFLPALNKLTGKTYRLPTEVEWEYSAKGGENYEYAGSDTIDKVAWYDKNSYYKGEKHPDYGTHPVKQKKPNKYGLYDMSGNVWEWCEDWYDDSKKDRVLRGGSWYLYAIDCRVTYRNYFTPDLRISYFGFRLCL